ncbi:MAG: sigma-E processing peptidase SpoIIGA [Bacilli bacterium]|nr:sigma-E processing peptidase SpoIIGA [Bacilli bacterium]
MEILILGGFIAGLLVGNSYSKLKRTNNTIFHKIEIKIGDDTFQATGLLDTGNMLKDNIKGNPVIVAEHILFERILPEIVNSTIKSFDTNIKILDIIHTKDLLNSDLSKRISLVSYSSIGQKDGILLGLKTDSVKIRGKYYRNVVLALTNFKLDSIKNNYQLLLPTAYVQ